MTTTFLILGLLYLGIGCFQAGKEITISDFHWWSIPIVLLYSIIALPFANFIDGLITQTRTIWYKMSNKYLLKLRFQLRFTDKWNNLEPEQLQNLNLKFNHLMSNSSNESYIKRLQKAQTEINKRNNYENLSCSI